MQRNGLDALFGRRQGTAAGPSAPRAAPSWDLDAVDGWDEHEVCRSTGSALPCLEPTEASMWEYPDTAGHSFRTYQHVLVKQALGANTLVSLPTGFGKTFVAAVVMRNFLRWFPTGVVVFMAPSRPLVQQQRGACAAVGINPERDTVLLTGDVAPSERRQLWAGHGGDNHAAARLFFCTPQTFENDLREGVVDGRRVVCVVVDEAHHASGRGYAYAKVRSPCLPTCREAPSLGAPR